MSEDLRDEVEAINSIYGEGCLIPADENNTGDGTASASAAAGAGSGAASAWPSYILQLPGEEASSLRLRFPPTYPATSPPEVVGTHHSSGGRRGAGARDLALFREAVGSVFQEGLVCLFDAVEEFTRRAEEEREREAESVDDGGGDGDEDDEEGRPAGDRRTRHGSTTEDDISTMEPPLWTQSEIVTEQKSVFIAHVAPVTSPAQARRYVDHLLASDKRIRQATHNITAWRIRGGSDDADARTTTTSSTSSTTTPAAAEPAAAAAAAASNVTTSYQDCDDDGETAAGGRVLHLMQIMDVWDAMVVVTRWYGGVKLGPRRFAVINTVARDGFVRAGMVHDKDSAKDKKKGK